MIHALEWLLLLPEGEGILAAKALYREVMGERQDLAAELPDEARARFWPLSELLLFAGEPGREVARRILEVAEREERGEYM